MCLDTDSEDLAGRLVSLGTMFWNRGLTQHVIIVRLMPRFGTPPPQSGAADAEIKHPSVENTELEGSPFKSLG